MVCTVKYLPYKSLKPEPEFICAPNTINIKSSDAYARERFNKISAIVTIKIADISHVCFSTD